MVKLFVESFRLFYCQDNQLSQLPCWCSLHENINHKMQRSNQKILLATATSRESTHRQVLNKPSSNSICNRNSGVNYVISQLSVSLFYPLISHSAPPPLPILPTAAIYIAIHAQSQLPTGLLTVLHHLKLTAILRIRNVIGSAI